MRRALIVDAPPRDDRAICTKKLPTCCGVPLITPSLESSTRPRGIVPLATANAYPPAPPPASSWAVNGLPTIAGGNAVAANVSGRITSSVRLRVSEREPSLALTVNVLEPTVVGVPVRTPACVSDIPAGSEPADTVHELALPPETVSPYE